MASGTYTGTSKTGYGTYKLSYGTYKPGYKSVSKHGKSVKLVVSAWIIQVGALLKGTVVSLQRAINATRLRP